VGREVVPALRPAKGELGGEGSVHPAEGGGAGRERGRERAVEGREEVLEQRGREAAGEVGGVQGREDGPARPGAGLKVAAGGDLLEHPPDRARSASSEPRW
jgi:hypothetical protein